MQMIVEIEVTRISIVIGSFRATQSPKIRRTKLPGGGLIYETDGDARRLA